MSLSPPDDATLTAPASDDDSHPSVRGRPCGRYLLLDVIGSGGNGIVSRAYDPKLNRQLAIKLLRGDANDQHVERIRREAQAIARVSHRNVLAVYDVGTDGADVFIAMELAGRGSLRDWLATNPARPDVIRRFLEAGEGLAAAHEAGLVHRDFKPGNVLLAGDGTAKVADFGLARTVADQDTPASIAPDSVSSAATFDTLTATGTIVGTPAYMAPEQLAGDRVDQRADQYAFCVSLAEALVGRRPQRRLDDEASGNSSLRGVGALGGRAGRRIEQALRRGLSPDPNERFPSMRALLDALRPRRPRAPWIAGAAAAVAAAVAAPVLLVSGGPGPCEGAGREWAAAWNDGQAAELRQAFLTTGVGYAEETFERFRSVLQEYGHRWQDTRTDVCRATFVEQRVSDDAFDLRQRCLDRRLSEAATLVDVWKSSPRIERAVSAALSLSPVEECLDDERLPTTLSLPQDPTSRAATAKVIRQLERAKALESAGRYDEQWELLQRVEPDLAITPPRTKAQHALFRANVQRFRGLYDESVSIVDDSLAVAAASGDDEIEALLLLHKQFIFLEHYKRFDRHLLAQTKLALQRAQFPPEAHAMLETHLASIAWLERDSERAIAHQRRAVDIISAHEGESYRASKDLNNLGVELSNAGRHSEARDVYARSLSMKKRILGPNHPSVSMSLYNIGYSFSREGEMGKAIDYYERALAMREATLGPRHPLVATTLAVLGGAHQKLGQTSTALEYKRKALELRRDATGPERVRLAWSHEELGIILFNSRRYHDAAEHFAAAAAVREQVLGPGHRDLVKDLYNLAATREKLGERALARAAAEQALTILEKTPFADSSYPADVRMLIARVSWTDRRLRKRALRLAREAVSHYRELDRDEHDDNALTDAQAWLAQRR